MYGRYVLEYKLFLTIFSLQTQHIEVKLVAIKSDYCYHWGLFTARVNKKINLNFRQTFLQIFNCLLVRHYRAILRNEMAQAEAINCVQFRSTEFRLKTLVLTPQVNHMTQTLVRVGSKIEP